MKVVCDTSALLSLAESLVDHRRASRLGADLTQNLGSGLEFVYHPLSLCELAANTHAEIHHSRFPKSPEFLRKSCSLAEKNEAALTMLANWPFDDPVVTQPKVVNLGHEYWIFVSQERMNYRSLTCTSERVSHQLAAADNQIFQTCRFLISQSQEVALFTGDNAMITAAEWFHIRWHGVFQNNGPRSSWKTCNNDNACYLGNPPSFGVGCPQRFLGPL